MGAAGRDEGSSMSKHVDRSMTARMARLEAQHAHASRKAQEWADKASALASKMAALRNEAVALAKSLAP